MFGHHAAFVQQNGGLTELQYGMSGVNVHFLFLTRPEEIKVSCG